MRQTTRRDFLRVMAAAGAFGIAPRSRAEARRAPNIVFILIDDMGYADLGCYGSDFHETPNLDALAAGGIRFTDAYAAAPVCSPTRASIMTGKYPARLHLTNFLKGTLSPEDSTILTAPYADQLPLEETTIAEALRSAGYATCCVGKWHLGDKGFWPEDQGFDVNIGGSSSGMPKSYRWPQWKGNPPVEGVVEGEYLTDRLTDEACGFIEAHCERPFFMYLSHYAVHVPIQAREDKLAKYQEKLKTGGTRRQHNPHYAAMVESVDDSVGKVLDTLRKCGIENDTIVMFFSDNGGLSVEEMALTPATDNFPFRAGKGYLYEGGIREPLIVSWPGTIAPGQVCRTPVCSTDFLPTCCALTGATAPPAPDGVDFSALLKQPETPLAREAIYWHYPHFANQGGRPAGAVRAGDWKLIEHYEDGHVELYDLAKDPGEEHDRAHQYPEVAARLKNMLAAWRVDVDATMPPPNPKFTAK